MSVTLVTFSVDDTSPFVSYSPFGDTFSTPNLIAGWNPYFDPSGYATSQGEVGNGTSLHITSLDGASLGLQWSGTGITLMGNATQATYSITLDDRLLSDSNGSAADNVLANIQGLNDTLHTIRLTAQIPKSQIPKSQNPPTTSMLIFDQAILFSSPFPVADNIRFQNQTLNDQQIAFLGSWSITSSVPGGLEFRSTQTVGDRAIANFSGTTLILLGQTSPSGGNYSVLLDNTMSTTLSARSSFTQSSSLLFFATDLDPATMHSIQVENLDGSELALLVGGFNAIVPYLITPSATNATISTPTASTTSSSGVSETSFPEGIIAAIALAGVLAFTLISGALYFFCVYRPRQRRRRRHWSGGSFYAAGIEGQRFTFDPPRGRPKAQKAGGAGAGVSGIVGDVGGRGGGGGGGGGRGEADVLDNAPGLDKSMGPKATGPSLPADAPAAGNGAPPALVATLSRQGRNVSPKALRNNGLNVHPPDAAMANSANANGSTAPPSMNTNVNRSLQTTPMSPNTLAAEQLNMHAPSFRPNPKVIPVPENGPAPHAWHMMPPTPAPMPPPSYEEDSAAQAAARQQQQHHEYVYAYPPQYMMPCMAPHGLPAYIQGPYMQMGSYPPGMPPPNVISSPVMSQMPLPQAYMQPTPGADPPPPNGAGPQPSMPSTPNPVHGHSYYHQSPQLQHTYPMMMPPPPNTPPPHGYEGGHA